uniref:Ovule protein n=1 Tax=Heterorhabditis bacteriophora TaxID=37862 RepID=A0A1I7WTX4_HETBA
MPDQKPTRKRKLWTHWKHPMTDDTTAPFMRHRTSCDDQTLSGTLFLLLKRLNLSTQSIRTSTYNKRIGTKHIHERRSRKDQDE